MPTYRELCKRAKDMGYELTSALRAELRMLSNVSDEDLEKARRCVVAKQLAR